MGMLSFSLSLPPPLFRWFSRFSQWSWVLQRGLALKSSSPNPHIHHLTPSSPHVYKEYGLKSFVFFNDKYFRLLKCTRMFFTKPKFHVLFWLYFFFCITSSVSDSAFSFASPPSGPSFGSIANQSAPSFGSLAQQGSGFGSQPSSFSGFGQQPQTGGEITANISFPFCFVFLISSEFSGLPPTQFSPPFFVTE